MCGCNRGAARPSVAVARPSVAVARPPAAVAVARPPAAAATVLPLPQPQPLPTVDTSIWGPSLWKVLHTASALTGSRIHIQLWRNLIDALKTGLPCPDCRAHYKIWVATRRIQFSMIGDGIRGPILRWILDLHNNVNKRNGRALWSIKQVMDTYGVDKPAKIAAALAALQSLQGIIGAGAYAASLALLQSL